ncbi:MAG: hypothetical protein H2172_11735 [Opitutus sp.]|nr:hypothetical protein [Opitutus sp.]MCS6244513.1 hypothetical protein [Opitutus sp.]MCS6277003.1 hypothetical protein [Opitutus sp.]MCS6277019.1 hypothetical protein [Opitutus sp.]MCS6299933.1 hypothetical protein [Opitutus sp.]
MKKTSNPNASKTTEGISSNRKSPPELFVQKPRPDLNGKRVKLPGDDNPKVWLIDNGYRRLIPSMGTYENLFGKSTADIIRDIDIDKIPEALPISDGAILACGFGTSPVYLIDAGCKRWVITGEIMNQYRFPVRSVQFVPPILLFSIPSGAVLDS